MEPAPALERRMNDLLRSLKRSGAISSQLYSRLYSSAGKTPLLYGLPKVHSHIAILGLPRDILPTDIWH